MRRDWKFQSVGCRRAKALDEAVKAEDKTDEANADTETAESAIAVPAIEHTDNIG